MIVSPILLPRARLAAWRGLCAARLAAGRYTAGYITLPRRGIVAAAATAAWGAPPERAQLPHPPDPTSATPPLPAARARALQRTAAPPLTFRIAGVTFEGRQDAVSSLLPGEGVRLVREPDNPADPAAVRVETLAGARLGYVPRDRTGEVCPPGWEAVGGASHCYARVVSVGQAHPDEGEAGAGVGAADPAAAPWGAAVSIHPGLPPLDLDALPPSLRPAADLAAWLPPPVWDALRGATATAAGFRCGVTGGRGAGCGVCVHEVWALDTPARVAALVGLQALAPEVHIVKHGLSLARPQDVATAVATLRSVNEWSVEEAAGAARAAAEAAAAAEAEGGWRLDLGWLVERAPGLVLPPDVAAVCVPWEG